MPVTLYHKIVINNNIRIVNNTQKKKPKPKVSGIIRTRMYGKRTTTKR